MGRMRVAWVGVALAGLMTGAAAHAEVTAQQVWDNWKSVSAAGGNTLSAGSERQQGDTLVVRDVTATTVTEAGTVTGTLPEIDFKEQGDGTVAVTLSPEYTLRAKMAPKGGAPVDMTLVASQKGLEVVASGSPGDITYALSGDSLSLKLTDLVVKDKKIELQAQLGLAGLKGQYVVKGTDMHDVASTLTATNGTLDVALTSPKENGTMSLKAEASDLTSHSNLTLVPGVDMQDLNAALKAGFALEAGLGYAKGAYSFDLTGKGGPVHAEATGTQGRFSVAMSKAGLHYVASSAGATLTLTDSNGPLPKVTTTLGETDFDLKLPVMQSPDPQPASLRLKLDGLSPDPGIWAMFDPGKLLPHDPITFELDLAGKLKLLRDLFDRKTPKNPRLPPLLPTALDVNVLHLAALGADLSGKGAFSFDYPGLDAGMVVPAPSGAIDLVLKGGMTLIDKLVRLGLVPQDQADGSKMMLGLFTKAGEGEDTLVSKIELTPDGQVFANGERLK